MEPILRMLSCRLGAELSFVTVPPPCLQLIAPLPTQHSANSLGSRVGKPCHRDAKWLIQGHPQGNGTERQGAQVYLSQCSQSAAPLGRCGCATGQRGFILIFFLRGRGKRSVGDLWGIRARVCRLAAPPTDASGCSLELHIPERNRERSGERAAHPGEEQAQGWGQG